MASRQLSQALLGVRTQRVEARTARAVELPCKSRIELQRLKNTAKGEPGVPVEKRIYVYIAPQEKQEHRVAYWIDATWSIGRTLDAVAKRLGIVNENARTQDEARKLHLLCDGLVLEPSQGTGKRIKDGDCIIIFRGTRPF